MTPVLKVLARPGDDGYEALCAQWRDSFLRGRQEKAERHALTGNLFLSADFGFGWGLLGDPSSPNSARPIAITAATATIVMIITSRIGMKREIEFRG